jgi:hypothetical protein
VKRVDLVVQALALVDAVRLIVVGEGRCGGARDVAIDAGVAAVWCGPVAS